MGYFTRFRRTWRPGYGIDVIDPNKVFDFERRLTIAKKVVIIVLSVILLISLIYFATTLLSSNNDENTSSNSIVSSLTSPDGNDTILSNSTNSTVKSGSVFQLLHSTNRNYTSKNNPDFSSNGTTNRDNSSIISLDSMNETYIESSLIVTALSDNSSDPSYIPIILSKSNDTHQMKNDSDLPCLSTGPLLDCIALSKSFETLTTFWNLTRKYNGSVEGYVMLRMKGRLWYPFCHANWTLEMGYSLCNELGYEQLSQLETVDVHQLKHVVGRKLGKYVSFHNDGIISQPDELSVVSIEGNVRRRKPKSTEIKCEVGYITCTDVLPT